MKRKSSEVVINPAHKMTDQRLVPRVQRYLDEHSNSQAISIPQMASDLQKAYGEYTRKKQKPFRTAVYDAYRIIMRSNKRKLTDEASELEARHLEKRARGEREERAVDCVVQGSDSENSFSSDNEQYVVYKDTNAMNSFLSNMYQKSSGVSKSGMKLDSSPATESSILKTANDTVQPIFAIDRRGSMPALELSSLPQSELVEGNILKSDLRNILALDSIEAGNDCVIIDDSPENCGSMEKAASSTDLEALSIGLNSTEPVRLEKKDSGKTSKVMQKTDRVNKKKNIAAEVESKKESVLVQKSTHTFSDIGGIDEKLIEVCDLLVHQRNSEIFEGVGINSPKGFLLHGPSGCGKTLLAHAIAGEFNLPLLKLSATEVVSGVSGESEEKIRDVFREAAANAPCVLFFDEIDAISPKRETAAKGMEQRIVSQLTACMDDLNRSTSAKVLLIGATNRLDSLDPALRRAGRFDNEISVGIPNEQARKSILKVLCRFLHLSTDFDYSYLARNTPGYVGADLSILIAKAALVAFKRMLNELFPFTSLVAVQDKVQEQNEANSSEIHFTEDLTTLCPSEEQISRDVNVQGVAVVNNPSILLENAKRRVREKLNLTEAQVQSLRVTMADFEVALKQVQPSAMREGFATVPDVTWDDIGALDSIREELQIYILARIRHPEFCEGIAMNKTSGILLVGPPGCGKTLLAKAVANESGINFISVKGPELLNMYVGESERAVRQVFQRASNSAPCVIFFDEIDALAPRRGQHGESGSSDRVVNQLLTEMDGVEERKQVFLMGATNRPDMIDPAVLRPGRLDMTLYVGLPTPDERVEILKTLTKDGKRPQLSDDVSLTELAHDQRCEGLTGADLAALVRGAQAQRLREFMATCDVRQDPIICRKHFDAAFSKLKPSVKPEERAKYEKLRDLCAT